MSLKALKVEKAPNHEKSLVEDIAEQQNPFVVPKQSRQKQKVITQHSLGSDMTKKILNTALDQLEEDKVVEDVEIALPEAEEDEDDSENEIVVDVEENDEEAKQLFELFKADVVQTSNKLNSTLEKTAHISDQSVVEIYQKLGVLLRNYKSGKLPKAINVIASQNIPDWFELLQYSEPENWSANAIKEVTTLFAQTSSEARCNKFYREVLLEYIKNLLDDNKKLPRNVWDALVAAARRPKPFILALMMPLAAQDNCSPKDARVISAMVNRVKLPNDLVNSFLVWLCEGKPITLPRTIFVIRFVQKGKVLAIRAVDAVYGYFMQFAAETEQQPVIWHKALKDFAKHYARDLTQEQKEIMVGDLLQKQHKSGITPEIREIIMKSPTREEGAVDQLPIAALE
ncbi:Bystin, putative [Trichomonas vaginalis G3]|uniref:Bystin, putative n=1 Tax=Trichomonas vaginalis (strain ATCC PRA-98 / G3) TaxID=412133 RepID=A2E0U1_TRIV3|nr:ribosome biogenesis [Trichomonas vaginalis G3]EAY13696.1 Bystin, putative [Trichomonas vaginalis G3]KAI5529606.1 ribosome biogenesis [Trichomonas vaginalis G3]|eukprot:XP_001325919.1 Bystin [Trichomonas vaginalis G3]